MCLNFGLVYGMGFGYPGSPLATACTRWFLVIALVLSVRLGSCCSRTLLHAGTWCGWDWRACTQRRLREYLKQSIPSAISGMVEEYQLQTICVLAGRLGNEAVATHNSTMMSFMILCSINWAINQATSVRLGHHLGNGDLPGAWRVMRVAGFAAGLWGLFVSAVLTTLRNYIGIVYSSQTEVQQLTGEITLLVGLGYFVLTIFYVSMTVLAASFRQVWIVGSFLIGAWIVCSACLVPRIPSQPRVLILVSWTIGVGPGSQRHRTGSLGSLDRFVHRLLDDNLLGCLGHVQKRLAKSARTGAAQRCRVEATCFRTRR